MSLGRLNAAVLPVFGPGGASVAGVGDVNLDGRDDIAVLDSGDLTIYLGGGLPGALGELGTISGLPTGAQVQSAGDVDGDTVNDILVTSAAGNYLIFGGDLAGGGSLLSLLQDPDGEGGPQLSKAIALPVGAFRAIGDFANIGPQDHLLTDLNDALDRAGLGHKIAAENQGGVLRLVAIDPAIAGFTLSALESNPAVSDLHFGTAQSAEDDGSGQLALLALDAAPENGRLSDSSAGDVEFEISIDGAAAVKVTIARADMATNTAIGNADRFDDLGAAVLVTTDRLNEGGTLEHQVLNVYLGGPRGSLAQSFAAPELVIEPGRASFASPGTTAPDSIYFGAAVEHLGDDQVTRTLLAVSGPAGDALRLYDGQQLARRQLSEDSATGPAHDPEPFVLPLATPIAPGSVSAPVSGIDLANDAAPQLRNAFALEGTSENEHLSESISLADFNGDGFGELLVHGDAASYLLLGPVGLSDVSDAVQAADVIIAADVGRPASRMGDVTGDGLADLVFVRPTTPGNFEIVIIAGGKANGVDLPRLVDDAWIERTLAIPGQARVKVLSGSGAGFGDSTASLAVLNWNDDGKADVALVRSVLPKGSGVQGYVLSGLALWGGDSVVQFGSDALLTLIADTPDDSNRATEADTALGAAGESAPVPVALRQVRAIVAGDVTGDGLDDLLLSDPGFAVFPDESGQPSGIPNLGRAYLVTGRVATSTIDLASGSNLIVQDFSLGGSLSALGDLNNDGYDDFAVGSTGEGLRAHQSDTTRESGLFIFYGQADFGAEQRGTDRADLVVTRAPRADLPLDAVYNGLLTATAGDFNGDNLMDLAVGEPSRVLTATGSGLVLDLNQSGSLSLFLDVSHGPHTLALTQADASVSGQFEFDGFGVLPSTPNFDLDGDGLADLVVGARGADVVTGDVVPGGGKAFFIYGSSSRAALPASATELGTRSFTGAGFFLVDEGTGRPTVFQDAPGETDPLFMLQNGNDAWYKFTTLGDGMPGNAIRVTPGAQSGFVAPVDTGASSLDVLPQQTVGNALSSLPYVDGARGSLFVGDAFTISGRMTGWSAFSGDFSDTSSTADDRYVTPVIFKATGDGHYQITGVGTARHVAPNDTQPFEFGLVTGSDAVGPGYFLGWYDGSEEKGDNAGAISYNTVGDTVLWLGPSQGAAGNVIVGNAFAPTQSFVRTYSIAAQVSSGAVLEFDLGQFLGWAGNPDAVGSASVVLHAPTVAEPIAAPSSVSAIAFSGGKVYFAASTPEQGNELWVTDGTPEGTHLVADLKAGPGDSAPINLIDLGGTLYFTANAASAGTQLWSTDGVLASKVQDDPVPGTPTNFVGRLGHAELTAAHAGPSDGVADVNYGFSLEILRASGTVDIVPVTLLRDDTLGNASLADPLADAGGLLDDLSAALASALTGASSGDLSGQVGVSLEAGHFRFDAADASIVRLTVHDGEGLGFAANQVSPESVVLGATSDTTAVLTEDQNFSLDVESVGGAVTTVQFSLDAASTVGNADVAALAAELQALFSSLSSVGFSSDAVTVSADGDRLTLSVNDPNVIGITIHGAEAFGFDPDQTSVRSVQMAADAAAPANGRLPADLTISVSMLTSAGLTIEHDVTLPGTQNADNGSAGGLADLADQLAAAINAAFAADFTGDAVSVDGSGANLVVSSVDASILKVSVGGAGALGFDD
ncbi:MAG TPA: hypothetical protein VF183_10570, partial [Acidimicrobiales bacterium]